VDDAMGNEVDPGRDLLEPVDRLDVVFFVDQIDLQAGGAGIDDEDAARAQNGQAQSLTSG
jgi:hypothetical protein